QCATAGAGAPDSPTPADRGGTPRWRPRRARPAGARTDRAARTGERDATEQMSSEAPPRPRTRPHRATLARTRDDYRPRLSRSARAIGSPRSDLPPAMLPSRAERDPERERDQLQIECEALSPDVQQVQLELVPPGNVPGGIHLGDAGEPRRDLVPVLVAGDLIEWDRAAVAAHLDLLGQERAGPDEAHVPYQDVPELG